MVIIAVKLIKKVNWRQYSMAWIAGQSSVFVWLADWPVFREGNRSRKITQVVWDERISHDSKKNCRDKRWEIPWVETVRGGLAFHCQGGIMLGGSHSLMSCLKYYVVSSGLKHAEVKWIIVFTTVKITQLCGLAAVALVFLSFSHVDDSCQSFMFLMCHLVKTLKIAGSAELSVSLCLTECPGSLIPGQDHLLPQGLPGHNQAKKGRAKVFIIVIIVTFSVSQFP